VRARFVERGVYHCWRDWTPAGSAGGLASSSLPGRGRRAGWRGAAGRPRPLPPLELGRGAWHAHVNGDGRWDGTRHNMPCIWLRFINPTTFIFI
jgi:hypothetical protein